MNPHPHGFYMRASHGGGTGSCAATSDAANDLQVDLTLATTYVPALRAMVETILLLLNLQLSAATDMLSYSQIIVVAAAALYFVRAEWRTEIIDATGCAIVVLLAVVVNTWRTELYDGRVFVHHAVDFAWMVVALLLVLDDVVVIPLLSSQHWLHSMVSAAFLAMHAFMALSLEDTFTLYLRGAAFTILCVAWTYTSYLKLSPGRVTLHECLHRFVLVLLAEWYISVLFILLALAAIITRVYAFQPGSKLHTYTKTSSSAAKTNGAGSGPSAAPTVVSATGSAVDADSYRQLQIALQEARGSATQRR
jgi:hypothetical protein